MTAPIVRFAPSPTGRIHIGNARTALLNYLFAKRAGGQFILRYDDTDLERSTREFADGIVVDIDWLGIKPDQVIRQSERFDLYHAAAEKLRGMGRLYACYETEDELERKRKRQAARHLPPVYDRAALKLTADEKATLEAEGRKPHWRFMLEDRSVAWTDLVRGPSHVESASLSDPVLIRADGTYLYTLPSVVDDIAMGVTHVIRGEDHVTNTGVQIQIFEALSGHSPMFGHHNLLTNASGEGLSKRKGHFSIASLREAEMEPLAVASLAVLVGSSEAVRPLPSLDELGSLVDLARLSRAPAKFDEHELDGLNARLLHQLPYRDVAERLESRGIVQGEAFWHAVKGNLERFPDVDRWAAIVAGPIDPPSLADADFIRSSIALLPATPWSEETWGQWTAKVKEATGRKGKDLFMPLRLALTGLEHGPELKYLLPLIGEARARERLAAAL
jgi:glutamyl-tRNA synthetase